MGGDLGRLLGSSEYTLYELVVQLLHRYKMYGDREARGWAEKIAKGAGILKRETGEVPRWMLRLPQHVDPLVQRYHVEILIEDLHGTWQKRRRCYVLDKSTGKRYEGTWIPANPAGWSGFGDIPLQRQGGLGYGWCDLISRVLTTGKPFEIFAEFFTHHGRNIPSLLDRIDKLPTGTPLEWMILPSVTGRGAEGEGWVVGWVIGYKWAVSVQIHDHDILSRKVEFKLDDSTHRKFLKIYADYKAGILTIAKVAGFDGLAAKLKRYSYPEMLRWFYTDTRWTPKTYLTQFAPLWLRNADEDTRRVVYGLITSASDGVNYNFMEAYLKWAQERGLVEGDVQEYLRRQFFRPVLLHQLKHDYVHPEVKHVDRNYGGLVWAHPVPSVVKLHPWLYNEWKEIWNV